MYNSKSMDYGFRQTKTFEAFLVTAIIFSIKLV